MMDSCSTCCKTNDSHRITRYDKIYSSKKEALELLKNNLRPYGEFVSIRYFEGKEEKLIIAFYVEDGFEIVYPSSSSEVPGITRLEGETIEDAIARMMFNREDNPKPGEMVVIDKSQVYIYTGEEWVPICNYENENVIDCGLLKDL